MLDDAAEGEVSGGGIAGQQLLEESIRSAAIVLRCNRQHTIAARYD